MDRLLRIISQSIKAVRAFKLRTFFCLLSVALGIASITIIVASVEGAYKRAFEIVARFGPDSLLVLSGGDEARARGERQKTITFDDLYAVRQQFDSVYLAAPMYSAGSINVSYMDRKYQTQVIGSTSDYTRAWTWPVIQGSDFTEEDTKGLSNVGLIGQHLLNELFGDINNFNDRLTSNKTHYFFSLLGLLGTVLAVILLIVTPRHIVIKTAPSEL